MVASIRLICGHDWEIFSSLLMDTVGRAVPRQVGLGSIRKVVEQAKRQHSSAVSALVPA